MSRSLLFSVTGGEVIRAVEVDAIGFTETPPDGEVFVFFFNSHVYLKDSAGIIRILKPSWRIRKVVASTLALPGEFIIVNSSGGTDIVITIEETSVLNDTLEVAIQRDNPPAGGAGKITVSKVGGDQLFGPTIVPIPQDTFDLTGQGDTATMMSDNGDSLWRMF